MEFFKSVFLHSGFLVCQNWSKSEVNNSIIHRNTKLNAETKNQLLTRHISRVLGRLYSLILFG